MKKSTYFLFLITVYTFLNAQTLTLSIGSNPSRINPILSNDSASSSISDWVFSGLFKYDKNGNIINDLAEEYYFEDNKSLFIKLKKNVLWHDNKPFTAKDVKFTYDTIMSPKVFTPLKTSFEHVQSINIIDDFTLKIVYKKPYFKALQIWMVGILPFHVLQNDNDLMTSTFNKNPIGTGPYTLKEFKYSKDIILKSYTKYYDKVPKIKTIKYKYVPDENIAFNMLKLQKLDVGGLTPLQTDRQLEEEFQNKFNIYENTSFSYTYMGFNLNHQKFKNKKIREAISLAINKQELIDILFFSHGQKCNGPFLPGSGSFNKSIVHEYNINKAKEILKSMGYTSENPFSFTVTTNANNSIRVYATQILQHQLSKVGIDMKIKVMEWQAFLNTVVLPKKFEAVILGWGLSLQPDARSIWHSKSYKKGGFNFIGYNNPKVDEKIELAEQTIDKEQFNLFYREIFSMIAKDIPYVFLYIPNSIVAVNSKIKNVSNSLIGIMHNQKEWIKP